MQHSEAPTTFADLETTRDQLNMVGFPLLNFDVVCLSVCLFRHNLMLFVPSPHLVHLFDTIIWQAILTGQRVHQVATCDWSRKHVNTGFSITSPDQGINTMVCFSDIFLYISLDTVIIYIIYNFSK